MTRKTPKPTKRRKLRDVVGEPAGLVLHTAAPHGAQLVVLVEDAANPDDRIYELRDAVNEHRPTRPYHYIGILGSELADLAAWWARERARRGEDPPEDR